MTKINRRHESALEQAERHITYTRERLIDHAKMIWSRNSFDSTRRASGTGSCRLVDIPT